VHHFPSLDAREIHAEFMEKLVPSLTLFSQEKLQVNRGHDWSTNVYKLSVSNSKWRKTVKT